MRTGIAAQEATPPDLSDGGPELRDSEMFSFRGWILAAILVMGLAFWVGVALGIKALMAV